MTYSFHPLASKELDEAVAHYLAIEPELAIRFLYEVDNSIDRILAYRMLGRRYGKHPSMQAEAFEHGLVYKVVDSEVLILAVMHLHRDPKYWVSRI